MLLKEMKLLSAAMFLTLISFTLAYGQNSEDENSLENSETENIVGVNSWYTSFKTTNVDLIEDNQVSDIFLERSYLEVGYSKPLGLKSLLNLNPLIDFYAAFSMGGSLTGPGSNQIRDAGGSLFGAQLRFPVFSIADEAGQDRFLTYLTFGGTFGTGACCSNGISEISYKERALDFGVGAEVRVRKKLLALAEFQLIQGVINFDTDEDFKTAGVGFNIGIRSEL